MPDPEVNNNGVVSAWAIILAGGNGTRIKQAENDLPKQFLKWQGMPLYWKSAEIFARCARIEGLIFVFPEQFLEKAEEEIKILNENNKLGLPWKIVAGGATRAESSRNAMRAVETNVKYVLVHDAARPFLKPALVWRILDALTEDTAGVVPVLPVSDTVKRVSDEGYVLETVPRSSLVTAQTPQGFLADALRKAQQADEISVTDDAMLLEKLGYCVKSVPGDYGNVKITVPEDLKMLEQGERLIQCVGFGYDAHRFGSGRCLKIGGISIPCDLEVIAHSDGDVLLHALSDAILGCVCLGDIGRYFPDSDPALEGISSAVIVDKVLDLALGAGLVLAHADLTVVAQRPKLAPFAEQIRKNVASLLQLPPNRVNFKATTEEKMGFTGKLEGIKAYAVVNGYLKED